MCSVQKNKVACERGQTPQIVWYMRKPASKRRNQGVTVSLSSPVACRLSPYPPERHLTICVLDPRPMLPPESVLPEYNPSHENVISPCLRQSGWLVLRILFYPGPPLRIMRAYCPLLACCVRVRMWNLSRNLSVTERSTAPLVLSPCCWRNWRRACIRSSTGACRSLFQSSRRDLLRRCDDSPSLGVSSASGTDAGRVAGAGSSSSPLLGCAS